MKACVLRCSICVEGIRIKIYYYYYCYYYYYYYYYCYYCYYYYCYYWLYVLQSVSKQLLFEHFDHGLYAITHYGFY